MLRIKLRGIGGGRDDGVLGIDQRLVGGDERDEQRVGGGKVGRIEAERDSIGMGLRFEVDEKREPVFVGIWDEVCHGILFSGVYCCGF